MITKNNLQVGKEFINEKGYSLRIVGWGAPPSSDIIWECIFDDGTSKMAHVGTTEEMLDYLNFQHYILSPL